MKLYSYYYIERESEKKCKKGENDSVEYEYWIYSM